MRLLYLVFRSSWPNPFASRPRLLQSLFLDIGGVRCGSLAFAMIALWLLAVVVDVGGGLVGLMGRAGCRPCVLAGGPVPDLVDTRFAGITLTSVASTILDKTGRAILSALLDGEEDPAVLADLASGLVSLGTARDRASSARE